MDLSLPNTDIKHNWNNHGLVITCKRWLTKFTQTNIISTLWHNRPGLIRNDEVNPPCWFDSHWKVFTDCHPALCNRSQPYIICHYLSVLLTTCLFDFVTTRSLVDSSISYSFHRVYSTLISDRWRTTNVLCHQWDLDYMVANDIADWTEQHHLHVKPNHACWSIVFHNTIGHDNPVC